MHYSNSLRLILMLSLFLRKRVNRGSEKLKFPRLKEQKQGVSQHIATSTHWFWLQQEFFPFLLIKLLSNLGFLSLYFPHILGVMCLKYHTVLVLEWSLLQKDSSLYDIIYILSQVIDVQSYIRTKKAGVLLFWKVSCSLPV